MSTEPEFIACPRCGAPLAAGMERCPICGMARGTGSPSPFTGRWWLIYVAVFAGLLAGVTAIAFAAR